jgi:hypothetical protein
MKTTIRFALRVATVVAFASALSPPALGQNAQVDNATRAERERRAGEEERRISTWELRSAEVRRPPERRRDANLSAAQIREDYKQLQIVNNDLARVASAGGELELKYVVKSVSEIKTRAVRLKENLPLPEAQKPVERSIPKAKTEAEQLKSSLIVLDNLIMEFVNNPIFIRPNIVNVPMSLKARRDLEAIIEVSDEIKKSSEKLKKLATKTQ